MTTPYTAQAAQTPAGVRDQLIPGFIGDTADINQTNEVVSAINSDGGVKQVSTLTVSGATNDKTYTVTINGIDVSYTADGTATIAEIAAGLTAAVEAEPAVSAIVTAAATTTTMVLTGRNFGFTFTVSEDDAQLSWAATTAAATASDVPFGRLVTTSGTVGARSGLLPAGLPTGFTAQVDTFDYTYNASDEWTVTVEYGGELYSGTVVLATGKTASTAAMLAELNAALPANSVIASAGGSDELVLTAEVAGGSFKTTYAIGSLATTLPSLTSTRSLSTSIDDALLGLSRRSLNVQSRTVGSTGTAYNPNDTMQVLKKGAMFVARDTTQTPAYGGKVYVDITDGKLYTAATSARVPVARLSWYRSLDDDLAVVIIND